MPTSCEYTSLNSKTLLLYFTTLSALLHVTVLRYNIVARHLWTCNILSARHFNQVYYCGTSFLHVSYLIIPHCTWLAFHYTAIKVNLFIDTRHALLLNFCAMAKTSGYHPGSPNQTTERDMPARKTKGSLGKIYTYGGLLLSYITLALFLPFLSLHLGLFSPYHTGFFCIFYLYHTCGNFATHISHLSLKVVPHFTWFFLPFVCFASDQNTL